MLTDNQQKVLDKIVSYMTKYGKSPTIEELRVILEQKSKRGVTQYLETLEKKGFIQRDNSYRGIKLGNNIGIQTVLNIPVLGYANAGTPLVYAEENELGTLTISKNIAKGDSSNYFFLKVEGTSMNKFKVKGKNIENGSYVLIKKDETNLDENNAYLFIVDGCATIKVPKKESEFIYLLPKSTDTKHKPIILSQDDNIIINGKVIDVYNFN
ncbi:MAG: S24 family peptidase [Candidatus Gracilibacteria bacterium]|nr:S24 family peptidase [Candidatus Gracilibacteria bacterium]